MQGFSTPSVTLKATGVSVPWPLDARMFAGAPPTLLCYVSSGASLTYSIEVTGDDMQAAGYSPSTGNWVGFTGMTGLTASAVGTLGGVVTAVRAHVTAYSSGSLTFQFPQIKR